MTGNNCRIRFLKIEDLFLATRPEADLAHRERIFVIKEMCVRWDVI